MFKKIIAILLVVALCNLTVTCAFAYTEKDAEEDRDQQRAVLALIGVGAAVGILFMLTKMNLAENYKKSLTKKPEKKNFKISFDLNKPEPAINLKGMYYYESKIEPCLKVSYSW